MENFWSGKVLSVFSDKGKATDFHKYVDEVETESVQFLDMQQELNETHETRASYEQLNDDIIMTEANANVAMLKILENILSERLTGYTQLVNSLSKTKQHIDALKNLQKDQNDGGSLRHSLDSLFVFIELEQQQAKQQLVFSDLKRILSEVKTDAQKKIVDYSNQLVTFEKDVSGAEKKVSKSIEKLEKSIESRFRLDIVETEETLGSPTSNNKTIGGLANFTSFATQRAAMISSGQSKEQVQKDRVKAADENIVTCEQNVEDEKRGLRKSIDSRDQVRSASRKAFQKLDKDCKSCIESALRKITICERGFLDDKLSSLKTLESNVDNIKCDADVIKFVTSNRREGCDMVQFGQALSVISRIHPEVDDVRENLKKKITARYAEEGVVLNNVASLARESVTASSNSGSIPKESTNGNLPSGEQSNPLIDALESHVMVLFNAKYSLSVKYRDLMAASTTTVSLEGPPAKGISERSRTSSHDGTNVEALLICCNFRDHIDLTPSRVKGKGEGGSSLNVAFSKVASGGDGVSNSRAVEDSVVDLIKACCGQSGRDAFCIVLNKYRSKTHTVDLGYSALACLLWVLLEICLAENDVHTAKVIMMLSQTFFRQRVDPQISKLVENMKGSGNAAMISVEDSDDDDDEDGEVARGVSNREYVNEMLIDHPIWNEHKFWEQALWECVQEQLGTVPYETPWFEMDETNRLETVERVHSVIFSQVMAITHSMMELGVSQQKIREFVYRMSTNHQLSEYQRQQLLVHLLQTKDS